jgi:hypothetical protein
MMSDQVVSLIVDIVMVVILAVHALSCLRL